LYVVSVFVGTKFCVRTGFICFVLISHGMPVDVSDWLPSHRPLVSYL